ncbi:MAG TPA: LemA family protein [Caldimonas sp.]|nr:LemA family protein [Caldimonas sp.]
MTSAQISVAAVVAVLAFWVVGAYNRLVGLRSALIERFAAVDTVLRQRQRLFEKQIDLLAAALANAGPRVDALRAACRQADAARAHAQSRPGAAGAVTSLRVAEEILADARARLPVQAIAGSDLPELNARIAEADAALAFARREFNAAVAAYNEAVRQSPTILVARLFGLRPAASF